MAAINAASNAARRTSVTSNPGSDFFVCTPSIASSEPTSSPPGLYSFGSSFAHSFVGAAAHSVSGISGSVSSGSNPSAAIASSVG
ncbi:unnamed protein product, partial [Protopolystoma xenopodis]